MVLFFLGVGAGEKTDELLKATGSWTGSDGLVCVCLGERRRRAARRVADDGEGVRADVVDVDEEPAAVFAFAMRDDLRGEKGSQESANPSRGVGGVRM
jgi:hypothetical protein